MKNFFWVIFLSAITGYAGAQSLQLISADTLVKGGTNNLMEAHASIKNTSIAPIKVKVRRTQNNLANGHISYFCWGSCYSPTTDESPQSITIPPGETESAFKGDVDPDGNQGTTTVKYRFYDADNVNDSVAITIRYQASTEAEVNNITSNIALSFFVYPNPSNEIATVQYSLGATNARYEVVLNDALGRTLLSNPVNDNGSLTLPLASYNAGMYLVSLVENGKPVATERLVVRH